MLCILSDAHKLHYIIFSLSDQGENGENTGENKTWRGILLYGVRHCVLNRLKL